MSVSQPANIINPILFNPYLNYNYPCIYFKPQLNFENEDNKFTLNNVNNQPNSISHINFINSINNFPIFLNNNNVKLPTPETIKKNLEAKNQNLNDIKFNFNVSNNMNNNLPSPTTESSNINDNSINDNLKNLQNFPNNNYISSAFKKNYNINSINEFFSLKDFPIFHKINNKNNIIINDILDEMTFNFESKSNSKNNSSKKNLFKLETQPQLIKKKRGRASNDKDKKNKTKRVHSSIDFDNILRKLQVHFLSFIIHFINEILDEFYPNEKNFRFLNLSYEAKKNVKHDYVENLKKNKIKDILKLKPSSKYKIHNNENINKEVYNKICESNPYLTNFFEKTYLDLFNKYYIKSTKTFIFDNKEITFKKASFFSDLLKANQISANKIEQIAKSQFCEKNSTFFVVNKN